MTEDLKAIDVLSEQFSESVKKGSRFESGELILSDNSPLMAQGDKVLRMYQNEAVSAPDDDDVKISMARHLYRIGWMYYDALLPQYLRGGGDKLTTQAVRNANNACQYMMQSYQLIPNSGAALALADVFRVAGFYGTAIHWLSEAGRISTDFEDADTATRAKAQRLDLQADGKVNDPPLSRKILFPNANTPGLMQQSGQITETKVSTSLNSGSSPTTLTKPKGMGGAASMVSFFVTLFALQYLLSNFAFSLFAAAIVGIVVWFKAR